MDKFTLTVLVENSARKRGLLAEHGLSFLIDVGERNILFDVGQTDILCHNANFLGIDLAEIDAVVLSHGHYDHTGGLDAIFKKTGRVDLFSHPDAFGSKYAQNPDGKGRRIDITDENRAALQKNATIISTESPTELGGGLIVTGAIPRMTDFEDTGGLFFKDQDCHVVDDIIDDQAVFFDSPLGIVVVMGCAHAGIINTLHYIKKLMPQRPFYIVVGGTHLVNASQSRIDKTIDALREFDINHLYPLHCTGFYAAAQLWNAFPNKVSLIPVGARV